MRLVDIDSLEYHGCYDVTLWVTIKELEENVLEDGRWIEVFSDFATCYKCSVCGKWQEHKTEHCCHCGRKMEPW